MNEQKKTRKGNNNNNKKNFHTLLDTQLTQFLSYGHHHHHHGSKDLRVFVCFDVSTIIVFTIFFFSFVRLASSLFPPSFIELFCSMQNNKLSLSHHHHHSIHSFIHVWNTWMHRYSPYGHHNNDYYQHWENVNIEKKHGWPRIINSEW